VEAAYAAIKRIVKLHPRLEEFKIMATSERSNALGEAKLILSQDNIRAQGHGASTDIIKASIRAYVNAVNRMYATAAVRKINLTTVENEMWQAGTAGSN
jgi:2-isopropylmalate synthase